MAADTDSHSGGNGTEFADLSVPYSGGMRNIAVFTDVIFPSPAMIS